MLCGQERRQLLILNIDFVIENKTQTQQTKHSTTGIFCSNLDLNTAGGRETVVVTLCRNFRLMHAFLLCRVGPYSQLPFLIYYLITMYYNSR